MNRWREKEKEKYLVRRGKGEVEESTEISRKNEARARKERETPWERREKGRE
jgi:hypothetical protein